MFNWNVYPNSRISKIRSPFLRKCALFVRGVLKLSSQLRSSFKRLFPEDQYSKLVQKEYSDTLTLAVCYVKYAGVCGDIGEFGTHGVTASVIAKQLAFYKSNRTLHMFDSFKGYPKAIVAEDLNSPHIQSKAWREGGALTPISAGKLRKRLQRILPPQQIKIYKGWYKDTVSTIPDKTKFAMLLMDCNMYISHRTSLNYLFEHNMISEGAIILFSDWNVNRASPAFSSRKAWRETVQNHNIVYSNSGRYSWGGQRFIVHSYKQEGIKIE